MTLQTTHRVAYARLLAPLVLIAFVVSWYEFSLVYIERANNQLVAHDNLSVYVAVQQVNAYLQALRLATYVTVAVGIVAFLYYFVKVVRVKPPKASGPT